MSETPKLTRREFLKLTAAAAFSSLTGGSEPKRKKEALQITPIEFGFSTHIHVNPEPGQNLTLDTFKKSVDLLAQDKQSWIRFNLWEWETTSGGDKQSIQWNETNLRLYDEAINYAMSKGLKVFAVMTLPSFAQNFSEADYQKFAESYAETLATRYKGKVGYWQIFNEADVHNFKNYSDFKSELDDRYLLETSSLIKGMAQAIKKADPDSKVTTNLSSWKLGTESLTRGKKFFSPIASSLDAITLSLYPDINSSKLLPLQVAAYKTLFGKEVIVGELGVPTANGVTTEQDQATIVPQAIDALAGGLVKPKAIFLYELTDETKAGNRTENSYGFRRVDGSPKPAYQKVIDKMQPPKKPEQKTP